MKQGKGRERQLWICIFSSLSAHHQCPAHTLSKRANLWPSHWLFVIKTTSSSRSYGGPVGINTAGRLALHYTSQHCTDSINGFTVRIVFLGYWDLLYKSLRNLEGKWMTSTSSRLVLDLCKCEAA